MTAPDADVVAPAVPVLIRMGKTIDTEIETSAHRQYSLLQGPPVEDGVLLWSAALLPLIFNAIVFLGVLPRVPEFLESKGATMTSPTTARW